MSLYTNVLEREWAMSSERLLFWFEEMGDEHNDVVGKKCANLGRMTQMGLEVPPGFAISIDMYRKFITETGAKEEITRYVAGFGELKGQGVDVFDEISGKIQSMIETKEMPTGVREPISKYYDELCERVGIPDVAVSVRSAGTESRPGMFETYLNVKGKDDLFEKIRKVWASAYTTRAVAFRVNKGLPVLGDELGIAVPKMVHARSSGICFTVDPVTGDDTKIILEANWGLGEGVVSGAESVDGFVVEKASLEIVSARVAPKATCVMNLEKGAAWVDVPENMQNLSCVSDEEIREVAWVAKLTERRLGCPQDMEWAVDSDLPFPQNICWLQTRPAKVQTIESVSVTDKILDLIVKRL